MVHSSGWRAVCLSLAVALLALIGPLSPSGAQQISYEYDALGRLILVTSPEGVAQYEYDAVGNILRITTRRYADVAGPVAILFMSPSKGPVGTAVQLFGKGFSSNPSENQVAFNGTPATVTAGTASTITVTVPSGATTGPISLTAPLGSATSPEPFTVLVFTLVPDQAVVARRGSVGFQAMLEGSLVTDVTWRVNDIVGGDATVGTISPFGVYTAPETIPATQPLLIEAVRTIDPSQVAKASVQVVDQAAGLTSAAPVTVGLTQRTGVEVVAGAVTVGVTQAHGAQAMSGPLSVMGGPVLTAVIPATGAVGTSVALTLSGGNLQGATAVRFLWNGSVDTTLAASGIAPAGDGTSVSFSLTISGSATQGPRVVQVVTLQGASTNFDLGSNVFTVTSP